MGKLIFIQQDNAPSHLKLDDLDFCEASKLRGFDIRLISTSKLSEFQHFLLLFF